MGISTIGLAVWRVRRRSRMQCQALGKVRWMVSHQGPSPLREMPSTRGFPTILFASGERVSSRPKRLVLDPRSLDPSKG